MGKGGKGVRRKDKKNGGVRNIVHIETVRGGANFGERHEEEQDKLVTAIRPAQLPIDDLDFLGRDGELAALEGLLRNAESPRRILAVSGQPGVGKTALAVRLAYRIKESFPDGQLYIDLRGADSDPLPPERALESFLRALGFSGDEIPQGFDEKMAQYRTALAAKRCIVVLDNGGSESQVRPLLPGAGSSVAIVTSRSNLAGLTGAERFHLKTLTPSGGKAVFQRIVGVERVAAEPVECEEIVTLCGGLPLAVRIAANKLRDRTSWTFKYYAEQLRDEHRRLQLLTAGDLEVRASFSLSYSGLTESDRLAFRRLGLAPAEGFSAELAFGLCDGMNGIEDCLERLLDANLLTSSVAGRFHMHDLLRVFSRDQLSSEEGESQVASLADFVLRWYADTAEYADQCIYLGAKPAGDFNPFETPQDATDWLEIEYPAIVNLLTDAYRRGNDLAVVSIAPSLYMFFERRLHLTAWKQASMCGLAAARRIGNQKIILNALISCVRMSERIDPEDRQLMEMLEEALDLARGLGSKVHESKVFMELGEAALRRGSEKKSLALLERAVELAKQSRKTHQLGNSLNALARAQRKYGLFDEALESYGRARLCYVSIRDKHCQGNSLRGIAEVKAMTGLDAEALASYSQAVRMYEAVHDIHCLAQSMRDRAKTYEDLEMPDEARDDYRVASEHFRNLGDDGCLTATLIYWGRLDLEEGASSSAVVRLSEACALLEQAENWRVLGYELVTLGVAVDQSQGRDRAIPIFDRAIEVVESFDSKISGDLRAILNASGRPALVPLMRV